MCASSLLHPRKTYTCWSNQEAAFNPSGCNLPDDLQSSRRGRAEHGAGGGRGSAVALQEAGESRLAPVNMSGQQRLIVLPDGLRCSKALQDPGGTKRQLFPKHHRGGDGRHSRNLVHSPAVSAAPPLCWLFFPLSEPDSTSVFRFSPQAFSVEGVARLCVSRLPALDPAGQLHPAASPRSVPPGAHPQSSALSGPSSSRVLESAVWNQLIMIPTLQHSSNSYIPRL